MKHLQKIFLFPALCLFFLFAGCSKQEDIYALPPIPEQEAVVTDENVSKPDEIKIFSAGAVTSLKGKEIDEAWGFFDSLFNSAYLEWGANGWKTQKDLKDHKKNDYCVELVYRYRQGNYFGVLMILEEKSFDYVKYTEASLNENRFSYSRISADSGEAFAENYAALLERLNVCFMI